MPVALSPSLGPALVCLVLAGCPANAAQPGPSLGAVVTFTFSGRADTMNVLVLDAATIRQAEQRVATGSGPRLPIGPIARGAGIDSRFPFHYLPDSIRLADLAAEVCDAAPMRTGQEVDDFVEGSTGNRNSARATWCPWNASPVAVRRR